jgi:glutathione S-transferase
MRARLALAVAGHSCELREVILRDKPQEMLAVSPKGTVPVLVDPAGQVIDESLDIMLWALQRHDPGQWLTPQQGDRETMVQLIARFDAGFKYHLDRYKYPQRHSAAVVAVETAQAHRGEAAAYLDALDAQLAATGWLFGKRAALADMAIFPFVRQFAQTDAAWFAGQPWAHVQRWLAELVNSSLYESIMKKYPAWQPGAAGIDFP